MGTAAEPMQKNLTLLNLTTFGHLTPLRRLLTSVGSGHAGEGLVMLGDAAFLHQNDAEIVVSDAVVVIDAKRGAKFLLRAFEIIELHQDQSEVAVRALMFRADLNGSFEFSSGFD